MKYDINGAHVTSHETTKGELFYLSSDSAFGAGEAIRGGIPIIAPWFGTFLGELQHGWARRKPWEVTKSSEGFTAALADDGLSLGLEVLPRDDGLRIRLSIENTTGASRKIQLAFHPYFAVSDVKHIKVTGLGGQRLLDRVSGEELDAGRTGLHHHNPLGTTPVDQAQKITEPSPPAPPALG